MEYNQKCLDENSKRNFVNYKTLNSCRNKNEQNFECSSEEPIKNSDHYLTRPKLIDVISKCRRKSNWAALLTLLESIFSSKSYLSRSFLKGTDDIINESDDELIEKADCECTEKIELPVVDDYTLFTVDIISLRKAYDILFSLNDVDFFSGIKKGINQLLQNLKRSQAFVLNPLHETINFLLIIFEIPYLGDMMKFEELLPQICEIVSLLPVSVRATFSQVLSQTMKNDNRLIRLHQTLQQRLTLRLLTTEYNSAYVLNQDIEIRNTVYVLEIIYYTSILAGKIDTVQQLENEREYNCAYFNYSVLSKIDQPNQLQSDLSNILSIHSMDCRYPLILYDDFINETLNDCINIENDYVCYKTGKDFSFARYSFLLNTNTKRIHLLYDNRIRMRSDFDDDEMSFAFRFLNPSFKIVVDRENIVDDTLNALENTITTEPNNLKKRLYIEFKNEETVDEGGVSKEFFQLIMEKLFNPDYGMFVVNEETGLFWFNPFLEEDMSREYKLIGTIVGLAIYNNIILDLKLPPIIYRKLMGKLGNFEDLKLSYPVLSYGLEELLCCSQEDVESIYDQNFEIALKDLYGNVVIRELKQNGRNIPLTYDNSEEFVQLYSDYLLNESVKHQFNSFHSGFQMVVNKSPLKLLFRPDEIELIVCGSKNFDFKQLEKVTKYDGGFSPDTLIIKYFWEIVHNMETKDHSNLLQFTTGSDRIPVGGMKNMDFVIVKNGSDTNRLPTAHTCYNTLLLPEYASKSKLRDYLFKAISYSTGFGIR